MDMLFLAVGQLAVGLIIAIVIMLVIIFLRDEYFRYQWAKRFYAGREDVAEVHRLGAWQYSEYDDQFFNKVEEYRNDFA